MPGPVRGSIGRRRHGVRQFTVHDRPDCTFAPMPLFARHLSALRLWCLFGSLMAAAACQAGAARPICTHVGPDGDVQRAMLADINLARTQPARFASIIEAYFATLDERGVYTHHDTHFRMREGRPAVREAIETLRHAPPLAPLRLVDCLSMGAQDHVADRGSKGATGHVGSDGSQHLDRASRYLSQRANCAENISYGRSTAREHVIALLVDDGVPSRGHRANILRPDFRTLGVGYGHHSAHGNMTVHLMCLNDVAS